MTSTRRRVLRLCGVATGVGLAGCSGFGGDSGQKTDDAGERTDDADAYDWQAATFDAYWYSLYNMSTNISMSGNGVQFPHNEDQREQFQQRVPAMLQHADVDNPPVTNPNLSMAPFTEGDPSFTTRPVLSGEDGRPDAATLAWDAEQSSGVVSPASVAWTHLKGVTWAKNFQAHFDILPPGMAPKFRAQMLGTLAQIGTAATLVKGGPEGNGALTKEPEENLLLVSGFRPADGTVTDETPRPTHHAAMLWFLSELASLATNGWFGYVNPEPLIPVANLRQLMNGMGRTVIDAFPPERIVEMGSTRDLGLMLSAVGYFGTQTEQADLRTAAGGYATDLAEEVAANLEASGRVANGPSNQAATNGAIAQGLTWASELDGVDRRSTATDLMAYALEELWDDAAGTFADGAGSGGYSITVRDAGDVTGGLNAADAVLGMDVKETFARFFDGTFNRGRLQRAERPPSRSESATHPLPLPGDAGGQYGQAAVYNAEVTYDVAGDEWAVADARFDTAGALYTANQDIWIGNWGGEFYHGRGVPGRNDEPPA